MDTSRPYTFDRVVRMLITIAIVAGIIILLKVLKDVLLPFCVACLIAYMLEPLVQFNRRVFRLKGRIVAITLTLLEAALVAGGLAYLLVPSVIVEAQDMARMFKTFAETESAATLLPEGLSDTLKRYIDFNYISQLLAEQDLEKLVTQAVSLLSSGINIIIDFFGWFLVVLYVIFIMLDYDRITRGFKAIVPPKYRRMAFRIGSDVKQSMNRYFRGQALIAAIVGVLFAIGFSIIGLPLAIALGLFIGLLNMVPYLQLVSLLPATLLCLLYSVDHGTSFWTIWLECMAVYCVVQAIQDLFLTPKIMGKRMGLNPAIILLSLSVWGALLGIVGMIIALPLTTLLISYYNRYVLNSPAAKQRREA